MLVYRLRAVARGRSMASSVAPHLSPSRRSPQHRARCASVATLTPEDRDARAAEIARHLPLVRFLVGRLRHLAATNPVLEVEDLLALGTEGLIAAIDTFDPTHGSQFSTWAILKIRAAVIDGLRELDPVARTTRIQHRRIDQATEALTQETGHRPTVPAIAAALGEPVQEIEQTL